MTFDEAYERIPGNGWLSRPEAELLWNSVNQTTGPILEVGCFQGRSSVLLAQTGRTMYCVDPFDDFHSEYTGNQLEAIWRENLKVFPNATLYRQKVEDWQAQPVGFAYLDGDHTYQGTRAQIEKALACGAQVIGIHDVNDTGGGVEVKRAALELLGTWDKRVERLAVWRL